jgi:GntR family transcriptional regulator
MGLFVGAGFSIAGLKAAAGVEGIVNFGTLQMPAEATANIAVSAEDAPVAETKPREESCGPTDVDCLARQSVRELADDMKGLVDGDLLTQRRFNVHLGYTYGVGLKADEILAGHLKAALKVKFLWFKRQWRRTIVDFGKGVSLGERMLIADEGSNAWGGSVPWGTLEMPNPFLKFRYLKRLSEKLGVNPMTISKTYSLLEKEGVLERRAGLPLIVSDMSTRMVEREGILQLEAMLEPAVLAARQLGLTPLRAMGIFRRLLEDNDK